MSGDTEENDDGYPADIAGIAASFQAEMASTDVDRGAAIRLLDVLGRLVTWKSLESGDGSKFDSWIGHFADLYGGMEVYSLLEEGWGRDLYSNGDTPDPFDYALFTSLLAVLHATDRGMAGADLNKRAYEAFASHALHPTGRALIDAWLDRLNFYVSLADERGQQK